MQVARVRKEKCDTTMCNRCVKFCPRSTREHPVIYIGRNRKATVDEKLCDGCGKCVKICREKAIEMVTIPDRDDGETADIKTNTAKTSQQESASKETAAPIQQQPPAPPKRKLTPEEKIAGKKARHVERVIRTAIACGLGIAAGVVSFFLAGTPTELLPTVVNNTTEIVNATVVYAGGTQVNPFVGILVLLVAIVIQKSIFIIIKIDTSQLGKKDWFYQGFMTFAAWYISWTTMLSTITLSASA